jgi:geranylgeranyl pyrophosphate synthase
MQDDVLDLFGDKGRGAPGADLREGKVSALVVEHLGLHPEDRDWLLEVLRAPRHETLQHDVDTAIDRFRTGGALAAVCERIRELSSEAKDASVLRDVPSLRSLICELSERVLLPIAHVMDS